MSAVGQREVFVAGLSEFRVSTMDDVMALLQQGSRNRVVRSTELNEASSRSHAILRLSINVVSQHSSGDRRTVIRRAKLNLVDLAGSEKWDTTGGASPSQERIKEMASINKSLSALGNCIAALTEPGRSHIPYRDSQLTVRYTCVVTRVAWCLRCSTAEPPVLTVRLHRSRSLHH